jgi:hypothetical protein
MKTLPTTSTHSGYNLSQVWRDPNFAIFSKTKPSHHNNHFEAIRIQHLKAVKLPDGSSYPDREAYPKGEQWGTDAWTCSTLQAARDKVKEWAS